RLPEFRRLLEKAGELPELSAWLSQAAPEQCVPTLWDTEPSTPPAPHSLAMYRLLLIQAFRPDRVIAAATQLVSAVLGGGFMARAETELELSTITDSQLNATTPALLCSVPGYDASGRVDDMATELNKPLSSIAIGSAEGFNQAERAINTACKQEQRTISRVDDMATELNKPLSSIAIGSAEGFNQAERAINTACKTGRWVMLKNVHLAPVWLVQLEKKLHSLQPHPNFRLFLTTEISPKLPVNLLRAGRVLVFEPPPGIRANLLRTFATVPAARMMKQPSERARLYFLLAWFHGIVQERLRYVPLGWAKYYEFNESDLRVACDTLDTWIDATAMGRTNLPPEKVPWEALVTLLSQCIYGGKIDNLFDQRLLHSFLCKLFTPKSFEADFALVANVDGASGNQRHITMPDGNRRDHFLKWIEDLSDRQTPSWLGLPNNAEKVLLTTQGSDLVSKLLKMQQLEDEEELAYNAAQDDPNAIVVVGDGRPAWMKTLHQTATAWLQLLPKELPTLRRTVENIKDPLYRFFEREVAAGAALLQQVLHDLRAVISICQQWAGDFASRVQQLAAVSEAVAERGAKRLQSIPIWLGGLLNPEAYITATRQCVAQANSWSLEELHLQVTIPDPGTPTENAQTEWSFSVTGLKLQGATVKGNRLLLTNTIMVDLPLTVLTWVRGPEEPVTGQTLTLPVYLNSARSELLFTVRLSIAPGQEQHAFYERGVALLTSTALN
ncbi:Dynein heavy chain, cytoplasmic, partial [Papilio machaon]